MHSKEFPRPGWITIRSNKLPISMRLDRRVPAILFLLCLGNPRHRGRG